MGCGAADERVQDLCQSPPTLHVTLSAGLCQSPPTLHVSTYFGRVSAPEEKRSMEDSEIISGRVTFDAEKQSLAEFLGVWKPSMELAPRVQWIRISVRRLKDENSQTRDVDGLIQAWEDLCHARKGRVDCTDVQRLAREHKVVSGKWMIHVPTTEVDGAWSLVANAILEGKLGDTAAKVSTNTKASEDSWLRLKEEGKKPESSYPHSHVICIYSTNFEDKDVVFEMRDTLRGLGFRQKLRYKPDAYTHCDIYSGNRWRIPATIYCV